MQLGVVGLGRMGAGLAKRLALAGHDCVAFDRHAAALAALDGTTVRRAPSLAELVAALGKPRTIWIMIPAAAVDAVIAEIRPLLAAGDTVIDGGNSHFADDLRRTRELESAGIHYLDVGVSGGVFGLELGFCLMIGGEAPVVARLAPIFAALAPSAPPDPAREPPSQTARHGYLHCGPSGAGHFAKMVHNGIEYGLMAAYAEGLNLLKHASAGRATAVPDAETAPLEHPERYAYDFDLAAIAEVWRHGSVIRSWLLDLAARSLARGPGLESFGGRVSDSGEGRWTAAAAIELGVPAPVLAAALSARFGSRGADDFANRLLSALRHEFGGHAEPPSAPGPAAR
jgi:6-phosphogluconate dehydrogenase